MLREMAVRDQSQLHTASVPGGVSPRLGTPGGSPQVGIPPGKVSPREGLPQAEPLLAGSPSDGISPSSIPPGGVSLGRVSSRQDPLKWGLPQAGTPPGRDPPQAGSPPSGTSLGRTPQAIRKLREVGGCTHKRERTSTASATPCSVSGSPSEGSRCPKALSPQGQDVTPGCGLLVAPHGCGPPSSDTIPPGPHLLPGCG